ncbi:MAG: hypothetical protein K9N09_04170 [Candidatus Cloacimonetes bacterium]|nr:hypothetical protein [Candidatus Cloacimonadota bacterium]MCF7814483.1 hypothetical protein [Candidatus Cloacimonadota bacterium]MCF7867875.1 hypothetical protein [Candidatus Cloacimonadota bacterium]MCF7883694.1 hypothetical protein [Candidatus Cloacimonadota bacterium]
MKKTILLIFLSFSFFLFAESTFTVMDAPNDDGSALIINWNIDHPDLVKIVLQKEKANGEIVVLVETDQQFGKYVDGESVTAGTEYGYQLYAFDSADQQIAKYEGFGTAKVQWFNTNKISLLFMVVVLTAAIVYFIFSAKSGKELYIRKISGLESMDESVGRATEMGKPILFVPGILDLNDMQTIAGLTILGHLAVKTAQYDTKLIVPVCRSMVLSTAKEIVKESYLKAGRPDAYDPDSVFYLTDDQFGFVAGVDGIIVREKPAANFYLGAFYAESLILAETGFASGAIQTAGTAMPSQLPFFVAACDYTLIGEELFAASAYLSKEPHQLGSLKGQDLGKAIFVIVLTAGIIMEIFGIHFLKNFLTLH